MITQLSVETGRHINDDVMTLQRFPYYYPFVWRVHMLPVDAYQSDFKSIQEKENLEYNGTEVYMSRILAIL